MAGVSTRYAMIWLDVTSVQIRCGIRVWWITCSGRVRHHEFDLERLAWKNLTSRSYMRASRSPAYASQSALVLHRRSGASRLRRGRGAVEAIWVWRNLGHANQG